MLKPGHTAQPLAAHALNHPDRTLIEERVMALWRTGRFSTFEIAVELGLHESRVCRILDGGASC